MNKADSNYSVEQISADVDSHREFLLEYWTGERVRTQLADLYLSGDLRDLDYYGPGEF